MLRCIESQVSRWPQATSSRCEFFRLPMFITINMATSIFFYPSANIFS
ncbi:Protein of unknown function [Pyronema omphalodes CBS 100304]|uniref:Uncharacterized protein n=1 Tax=Pyronema omphalodes (strain CBS 100304) TaxID=1076935 RepID=U4L2I0_PYROM|nr:Protein of unknown function [Pyronema omphalodes CBS 100304]